MANWTAVRWRVSADRNPDIGDYNAACVDENEVRLAGIERFYEDGAVVVGVDVDDSGIANNHACEGPFNEKPECGADPECDRIVFGPRATVALKSTIAATTSSRMRDFMIGSLGQVRCRDHHALTTESRYSLFRQAEIVGQEMARSLRQPIR